MSDYYESAEGRIISLDRALVEVRKHGLLGELDDFFKTHGVRQSYKAQDVLIWLGY
jgi:hypothetical protein